MSERTTEARRWYELWQRVDGGVNNASTWMVWEVGPERGGEHWFSTEQEAREFIESRLTRERDET